MTPPPAKRAPLTHTAHRFIEQAVERARAELALAATGEAAPANDAGKQEPRQTGSMEEHSENSFPATELLAIDATAGNGHDTLFLARLLGAGGAVAAFDIQKEALQNTAARLQAYAASEPARAASDTAGSSTQKHTGGQPQNESATQPSTPTAPKTTPHTGGNTLAAVRLIEGSHAQMLDLLPANWRGRVCVIIFNLGYLPGADKALVTETHSTLPALAAALQLLCLGGLLSVMCYRGHPQGMLETAAIADWLPTLPAGFTHSFTEAFAGAPAHAPILLRIERGQSH